MKFNAVARTMAASAVALLIAGCGGGGGGDAPSLEVKGTAAVGAALSGAAVAVKCATGSGTGTTTATGSYTVAMPGAALPCIIQVSGEVGGVAVKLHSVAEAGTGSGSTTTAVANVTPVTEMIVAQLLASLPADAFASFDAQKVTTAAITTAVTAIVDALKAAGVDLGSIDPLKATLVPASGTTAGNDYDKALDALGEKVPPESLPLVVNQIANASASGSSEGLGDAMVAVSGGTLAGCPQAVSGKYRTLDFVGGTSVVALDFAAGTLTPEGAAAQSITLNSDQACEFSLGGRTFVFGPSGAGAFRSTQTSGYIFPVQVHNLAATVGTWTFMESGIEGDTGTGDNGIHFIGQLDIKADGKVEVCEYELGSGTFGTCVPDTDENASIITGSDGSFGLQYGTDMSNLYGYRTPGGALTLFTTNNPTGVNVDGTYRTHAVLTKLQSLPMPEVGSVTKFWDMRITESAPKTFVTSLNPLNQATVTAVDNTTNTITRSLTGSASSVTDSLVVNKPLAGMRFNPGSSSYQTPLVGLGITVIQTARVDGVRPYSRSIAVGRP